MVEAELTDLDNVGPARSDSLVEAGYEDVESVADADPATLAKDADVPEDTAIGFVVQAENIVAEEGAEIEEQEPVTQEIEEAIEEEEEDLEEEEEDLEEEQAESFSFEIEPETALEHDVLFASVMRGKETMLQANRTNTELFDDLLNQMRSSSVGDVIELETDSDGLNTLHNHVRKLSVEYQGNNLINHMNAMKAIQSQVNEARQEHLF